MRKSHIFLFLGTVILLSSCGVRKNNNTVGFLTENKTFDIYKDVKNKKLTLFLEEWIGVKHKLGGNDKDGVDCSSFSQFLQKTVFDNTINRIAKDQALQIEEKPIQDLSEGDLVFFSFLQNGSIDHVGVYLQNDFFVHASTSRGVVIDYLKKINYQKYLIKAGTVKHINK